METAQFNLLLAKSKQITSGDKTDLGWRSIRWFDKTATRSFL